MPVGEAVNRTPLAFLREVLHLWLLCCGDLDESVGGWTGFDPVDWQEGFEFVWRWVVHELLEYPFEIGKGVCLVAADLLNEGVDDGASLSGMLAAHEHPILVA
mgnify:CR=1 FL=1|jgi:hypothetical protein